MDSILDACAAEIHQNLRHGYNIPKQKAFGLYHTHCLKLDHWCTPFPELQVNPKRVDFFIANPKNSR